MQTNNNLKKTKDTKFPLGTPFRLLLKQKGSIKTIIPAFAKEDIVFVNGLLKPSIIIKDDIQNTKNVITKEITEKSALSVLNLFSHLDIIDPLQIALQEGNQTKGEFYLLKPKFKEGQEEIRINNTLCELDNFQWQLKDAYIDIKESDLKPYYEKVEFKYTLMPESDNLNLKYSELEKEVADIYFNHNLAQNKKVYFENDLTM